MKKGKLVPLQRNLEGERQEKTFYGKKQRRRWNRRSVVVVVVVVVERAPSASSFSLSLFLQGQPSILGEKGERRRGPLLEVG